MTERESTVKKDRGPAALAIVCEMRPILGWKSRFLMSCMLHRTREMHAVVKCTFLADAKCCTSLKSCRPSRSPSPARTTLFVADLSSSTSYLRSVRACVSEPRLQ
jgi:hypothetical protein